MILPDANLLLYAVNRDCPDHRKAFSWWRDTLEGGMPVRLTTGVVFAFVRLATNRRVFAHPLTTSEAFEYLENWREFSSVRLVENFPDDIGVVRELLESAGTAGTLVSDAQIAAIALRIGGCVHTVDDDFQRFPGVKWLNPLRK